MRTAYSLLRLVSILLDLAQDALQFLLLGTRSSAALKAENIFLRKQLALYLEREAKSRRATDATRLSMVLLSRLFAWQNALTPFQAPQANAFCERLIGTVRRECLDFLIPLNDGHLRSLLKEWVTHYNRGRPHASLGPGIPDLRAGQQRAKLCGHHVPMDQQVVTKAILGGLHHEYSLERRAA